MHMAMNLPPPSRRINLHTNGKCRSLPPVTLAGLVLGILLIAAVPRPLSAAAKNILHRGTASELRSLDPQAVIGNTAGALMYELFEGLMTVDQHGNLVPGVAESFTRSEDGLTYTFKLRKGLLWSDGTPLTAADFVYSWKRILDPKNALRGAGTLFPVKNAVAITRGEKNIDTLGIRARDPLTLDVALETRTPYFTDILAGFPTAPVPRHVVEKHGAQWTMPGNIVSNGAYNLAEWISNTHYRLVRNTKYREAALTKIDEVFYYPIADRETAEKRFRAGELDIVLNTSPNRLEWLRENLPGELRITSSLGIRYLVINTSKPPLNDVRVRKALSIAIDREVIATRILKDGSDPTYQLVPPALPGYGPNPPAFRNQAYSQRVAEAKRLIAAAGFGSSKPLRFSLHFQNTEEARRAAVALQAMWRPVGANAELATTGFQGQVNNLMSGDYNIAWFTYYVPYSDATAFLHLLESANSRNYSRYANPKFDEMLLESNNIVTATERAAFLRKAEQTALADFPVIPLFVPARVYLVSKRVQGWEDHLETHPARFLSIR